MRGGGGRQGGVQLRSPYSLNGVNSSSRQEGRDKVIHWSLESSVPEDPTVQ